MHVLEPKKSVFSFILLNVLMLVFISCGAITTADTKKEVDSSLKEGKNQEATILEATSKEVTSQQSPLELQTLNIFTKNSTPTTLIERFSYTYGYMLMDSAMRELPTLNPEYFLKGAYDIGVLKSELLTKEERNSALFQFQDMLISEAGERVKELSQKNLKDAESFLAVNSQREGITTTDSGLQYEILTPNEGLSPTEDDVVKVNYRLTYLDGREGDSSVPGIPSTFKISKLVDGFKEGLYLMTEGSSYRFYVHPKLGYGESGSTRIEPNTLLIFDVELVEIVD
ncbi:MAG: FKBP-type peptidyl-prolyl cis-trans isomerase [Spirochaetia bacterium]|nr:FKBP-type peptidyl-prolyl cis-trans isomerase [Spirochaetia bacterium]